jgi:GABA(A) receptor-associated protein
MSITLREPELQNIRKKYPDRIPIIVTRSSTSDKNTPDLNHHKFLVPNHFTFGDFIHTMRKRLSLTPEKAIFIFVTSPEKKNEVIPSPSSFVV